MYFIKGISSILFLLLLGCASTGHHYTQISQNWHGRSVALLTQRWGQPNINIARPTGDKTYIYKIEGSRAHIVSASPTIGVHVSADGKPIIYSGDYFTERRHTDTHRLSCFAIFTINARGIIVNAQFQGNNCQQML